MNKKVSQQDIEKLVARQRAEMLRDGLHQQFHPNGRLFREWTVVNGKSEGILRVWDENGTLVQEKPKRCGLDHGIVKQWNSEGTLLGEYKMEMGKGIIREWNQDGSLATETEHFNGDLTHVKIYDDRNKAHEGFLWNDTPISKRKFYGLLKAK